SSGGNWFDQVSLYLRKRARSGFGIISQPLGETEVRDSLSVDNLDQAHLTQLGTNECLQTRHALIRLDGANAHALHGLVVVFVSYDAYLAPVSPVHDFYRISVTLL